VAIHVHPFVERFVLSENVDNCEPPMKLLGVWKVCFQALTDDVHFHLFTVTNMGAVGMLCYERLTGHTSVYWFGQTPGRLEKYFHH